MRNILKFLVTLMIAVSCVDEVIEPPVIDTDQQGYNTYLLATTESTKAAVSNDYTKLSWTQSDTLSVYTSMGRFVDFIYDGEAEEGISRFKGILEPREVIDRYVVFPSGNHKVQDDDLYINFRKSYEHENGKVQPLMMAEFESNDKVLEFKHLAGMFLFDIVGMPEGAASFKFTTSRAVTGDFPVSSGQVETPSEEYETSVVFNFPALNSIKDMKFFVPVPVGEYHDFSISISDADNELLTKSSSKSNKVLRNNLKKFTFEASDVVYVTVNGTGDGSGSSWSNSTTLTAALENAQDGQVIRVAGGTYIPDKILSGSTDQKDERKTFHVKHHVAIQGSYNIATSEMDTLLTPTIISGQVSNVKNAYHSMVVAAPGNETVSLSGLCFTKGVPMLINTADLVNAEASTKTTTTSDGITVDDYRGGGLYVASNVLISSCHFKHNTSPYHGQTNGTLGLGLYVKANAQATVENSTFSSNTGGACGAAIYTHGKLNLNRCFFEGNSSTHSGAVHNSKECKISYCEFRGNEATNGFAGALRHQSATKMVVSNTSFIDNKASNHGGAIHNNRNTIELSNCYFKGNSSSGYGGAIANWGGAKAILNMCEFVSNTALQGGAISNMVNADTDGQSEITLMKCAFKGNQQSLDADYGGAVVNNGSKATISGCSFENLRAKFGGAIVNKIYKTQVPDLVVDKGSRFVGGIAQYGGAIANLAANAKIKSSDFEKNSASVHAGALYNSSTVSDTEKGTAEVHVESSDFIDNHSVGNGGAIMNWYAETNGQSLEAPKMSVKYCTFQGNKIDDLIKANEYQQQGGAIANQCSILSVENSKFIGNHAAHAGAIYSYDYSLNNSTPLSDKSAYTYVYNSLFNGNTVDLTINSSAQGADLRSHGLSKNILVNSTFTNGNAPTGSVRLRTGATCYVVSCTFTKNESGPYNQSSVMKLYNTISYGNTKSKYNYYANQPDSADEFYESLIGSMSLKNRYSTVDSYLYDKDGNKTAQTLGSVFGEYNNGVYPVIADIALQGGMTTTDLSTLATVIKADMPDLDTKYFIWDQRGAPRSENEKVMGAYIGDVYLDPNRYGFLNNTELIEDNNLRGLITDDSGQPVEGVAVSDGYDVVTTDANGVYQFMAHQDARFICVSVPAEYEIPYLNNKPDMWVRIDPTDYEIRNDFVLKKRSTKVSDFTIFSLADTHVANGSHYERFSNETMADLRTTVSSGNYNPNSFAVILGDIMFDNYTQVENVKSALGNSPVPVFPCFGNHDCSSSVGTSEVELISKFQEHFGPVDYSFNIGDVHFVSMKDMIYEGKSKYGTEGHNYVQGFLDHQVEWLRKDLDAVQDKQNKMVILCVHVPLRGSSNTSKNYKAVVQQLLQFKEVHVLSGHHHGVYNHISANDKTVGGKVFYDHNQVAAAGAWWRSNLNPDGSPNGYMIYNIAGNTIGDYYLKGTNLSSEYQMRVYDGGTSYTAPYADFNWLLNLRYNKDKQFSWTTDLKFNLSGKFVVHVFNADVRDWKVYFVQNGVRQEMTRTSANWFDVASYSFAGYYTDWSSGGAERYSTKVANTNFWYIDAPSGNPSTENGWTIEAVHTFNGKSVTYTANSLHSKYSGFAY